MKLNCDSNINGLLLQVLFHVGALNNDSFSRLGHCHSLFPVVGVGFHGQSTGDALLRFFTHGVCCFVSVKFFSVFIYAFANEERGNTQQERRLSL